MGAPTLAGLAAAISIAMRRMRSENCRFVYLTATSARYRSCDPPSPKTQESIG
jgi:hypothetical protein